MTTSHAPLPCTVIVRARNAAEDLSALLPVLRSQEGVDLSIVLVDNESTDSTQEIARGFGAEVVEISHAEFSWGRALNRGLACVSTPVALLLSADAVPTSNDWALKLGGVAAEEGVGGVYGRQVPRDDAPLDEWVRVRRHFPDEARSWTTDHLEDGRVTGLIASNACAAISMKAWAEVPFREDALGAEERPWVADVLGRGYSVRYVAGPPVAHSHREPASRQARRLWELHVQFRLQRGEPIGLLDAVRVGLTFSRRRLRNMRAAGAGWRRRVEGLARLPWEATVLMWTAARACLADTHSSMHRRW